jgi:hypothetical protein
VLVAYGVLDRYVLEAMLPKGASTALIRVAGFITCLLFVSSVFVNRGLEDLKMQRLRERGASIVSFTEERPAESAVRGQKILQFGYCRRYIAWGWAATLAPIAAIALSIYLHPDNSMNVLLVTVLLGWFVLAAVNRSRWTFVINKTGFEWGGFFRTTLRFADVQRVYVNEEYRKPILVIERKGTVRKGAFWAQAVENFDDFAKVAIESWSSNDPKI